MFVLLFFAAVGGAAVMAILCCAVAAALFARVFREGVAAARALAQKSEASVAPTTPPQVGEAAACPAPVSAPTVQVAPEAPACKECLRREAEAEKDPYEELPDGRMVRSADYETRADGERVRKDRWEVGMRNIAGILTGPRAGFEIDDVVEKVRALAKAARADYESGGHGVPGSAPVWGPCPDKCDHGSIIVNRQDTDCLTCEGRGRIILEPALVTKDAA